MFYLTKLDIKLQSIKKESKYQAPVVRQVFYILNWYLKKKNLMVQTTNSYLVHHGKKSESKNRLKSFFQTFQFDANYLITTCNIVYSSRVYVKDLICKIQSGTIWNKIKRYGAIWNDKKRYDGLERLWTLRIVCERRLSTTSELPRG